ncbi:hypothetical protein E3N88_05335 [Mikania micrantha]|uniref:Lunapark zinc ribbon domain-containing protein n=1 Tax=Mikania micrantha TaxID=192012 RepID=A0A5N6PNN7_9ASTR|nr:hypothetical protein E3N88_05335 [Mikania micrantha]
MAEEKDTNEVGEEKNDHTPRKGKKSIFSRFWNGLLRLYDDDFERRLRYISKEETAILARMKKRSTRWRKTARNLIVSYVLLEVVAIGYAILTTKSVMLEWKMRSLRVLPIFVLPRYDPDPAAKAAAAAVLASKLGADSGLQLYVDESHLNQHDIGKSSDFESMKSSGLRRRNPSEARSPGNTLVQDGGFQPAGSEVSEISLPGELVVEHQNRVAMSPHDSGWMARLAALLVGEDPTQSYALICGNCHMHNGLARKEDFLVFTYYCPHCHALNKPRNLDENFSCTNSPNMRSLMTRHNALNKVENPSDPNSLDARTPPTISHLVNKPKKSSEKGSDINMESSMTNHHHMNKPKKSGSDINIPNMKSSTTSTSTVVNADSDKQSMSQGVPVPIALSVDEKNKIVPKDPDNH